MKNRMWLLLFLLLFPLSIKAVDYDITDYYLDAYIKEDGDVFVKELMVLDGTFNGYQRDLKNDKYEKYAANDIVDVKIYGGAIAGSLSFNSLEESKYVPFSKVNYDAIGTSNKYYYFKEGYNDSYRMYRVTNNNRSGFLLTYTLDDVLISHNDYIELAYEFIGSEFVDSMDNVNIRINYPKFIDDKDFLYWFKGDLTGNYERKDTREYTSVVAHVDTLPKYSPVTFRTIVNKDVLDDTLIAKKDSENVYDKVVQEEKEAAEEADRIRKKAKMVFGIGYFIEGLYLIILIYLFIKIYRRYDKERKPQFQNKYNREFIDDYNVEVIDYLMKKDVTPSAMSASILNMVYKKNIKYEAIDDKHKDYKFTLENTDGLNETENSLVNFLFNKVGSNNTFTTKELKEYGNSTHYDDFISSFTNWKKKVISDGKNEEFFEEIINRSKYLSFASTYLFIIIFYQFLTNIFIPLSILAILLTIIFNIYVSTLSKKTEKGIEHYAKWNAFKNFLDDFGTFELKELPEIELWERYLVYATIFGLAKKVSKAMNVYIEEYSLADTYNNLDTFTDFYFVSSFNNAFTGAYNNAISQSVAASSYSGSGHGGGFSSGGSFGGGGGGGHGF